MNQNLKALLILNRLPGFGIQTLKSHLQTFRSAQETLNFLKQEGHPVWRDEIARMQDEEAVDKEFDRCSQQGIRILGYGLEGYPKPLFSIYDPPMVLYLSGNLQAEDMFCLAIVGTREPSSYGLETTRKFASFLAEAGITVVSGFAKGIDSEAHRGALSAKGNTVAFLGCGLDVVYPAENKSLYEQIRESGALVSEYPPGTPPLAPNFPKRNRLISGLSLGVLVVEAHEKSGSLITASLALEQGKEVFAVPGRVDSLRSKGTNRLIKQGACLVERPEDILAELHSVITGYLQPEGRPLAAVTEQRRGVAAAQPEGRPLAAVTEQRRGVAGPILDALGTAPLSLEELTEKTGFKAEKVAAELTLLEIKRKVVRLQDARYEVQ